MATDPQRCPDRFGGPDSLKVPHLLNGMMEKKPKTRMAVILDKSGSMATTKSQAVEGLNEQIQQAREHAKEHDLRCSLVTFNGEVFEHLWDVPAEKLIEAKPEDYNPNGSTAWLDAVGYTIQKLLSTEGPEDAETAYLVYVISDGQTNADMHYNGEALKELIEGCMATKRWTITYMGHNARYLQEVARQTGVPLTNCAAWSNKSACRHPWGIPAPEQATQQILRRAKGRSNRLRQIRQRRSGVLCGFHRRRGRLGSPRRPGHRDARRRRPSESSLHHRQTPQIHQRLCRWALQH